MRFRHLRIVALLLLAAACTRHTGNTMHGNADQGRQAIEQLGCGACHEISGVVNAHGRIGPILTRYGQQGIIAGRLPNTADNLARWIRDPQSVSPGTLMPTLGIDDTTARNIAAYLYTVR